VEVLRYINEDLIDGHHEMMIWIDPGYVEVQHNSQENKMSKLATTNSILYDNKKTSLAPKQTASIPSKLSLNQANNCVKIN